jgi:hypothetical protein
MKRRLIFIPALATGYWLLTTIAHAETNTVIHVPAFDIPAPTQLAGVFGPFGLWLLTRAAVKILDNYQTGRPWISKLVWLLEHISLNKNVATVDQRIVGADQPPTGQPIGPALAKKIVGSKTPDGLP